LIKLFGWVEQGNDQLDYDDHPNQNSDPKVYLKDSSLATAIRINSQEYIRDLRRDVDSVSSF